MTIYSSQFTPQSEAIPDSTQVPNSAGGYAWEVDDWKRLDRFLILGAEGGTYYIEEKPLIKENAQALLRCLDEDGFRAVERIAMISDTGRAAKNSPAIFALALAASHQDPIVRHEAFDALRVVCRTGTHLFEFLETVLTYRRWGRGLRKAVGDWYMFGDPAGNDIAMQMVKYRQRKNWTHRDVLRLAHPNPRNIGARNAVFHWMATGDILGNCPPIIEKFVKAQEAEAEQEILDLMPKEGEREAGITWEMIPDQFLTSPKVWGRLIESRMPATALIRNLGRVTSYGTFDDAEVLASVVTQLTSDRVTKYSRVHPIQFLSAMETYRTGKGVRGSLTWKPIKDITEALEIGFYASFKGVIPTNQRLVLALDVSGSMMHGDIAGVPNLTPRVASAALALVTAKTEPIHHIVAFSHTMMPFERESWENLPQILNSIDQMPYGGTDCALPMLWALENNVEADAFIIYTDSETWAGRKMHPVQALREYRTRTGIPAKLIVVAMTSNGFSIADPNDGGMLDVCGFDAATPRLIQEFILGNI